MMTSALKCRLAVIALLLVFFAQSFNSLRSQSATFDEVQYFGIGKYLLTTQKWDVMGAILHPPGGYYLSSLPLLCASQPAHVWEYDPQIVRDRFFLGAVDYYRGQTLLADASNQGDRLLTACRLTTLLVALLLGWYVWRFGSELYGAAGGLTAVALFAFNPAMLAFSGLIVPDLPLTAFGFIAFYYLWRVTGVHGSQRDQILCGLFLGLALQAKFTAVLLIPLVVAVCLLERRRRVPFGYRPLGVILGVALLLLCLGYGFNLGPYFEGFAFQIDKSSVGQAAFLMGQHSDHGWWYFYPLAFLIKTPLGLTVMFLVFVAVLFRREHSSRRDSLLLIAPILTLVLAFSFSGGAIGFRYLLPVYPFMFVAAGSLCLQGTAIRNAAYALTVWCVIAGLWVSPHYLAYFNELVGGPSNGYRYLVDSNLDWGQDLIGLKRFMDRNGIKRVSLSYFGADSPQRYGIDYDWLPSYYLQNPRPDEPVGPRPGQLLAISATTLQGVYLDSPDQFAWLKKLQPVAVIGHSIFIYDLDRQPGVR